MSFEKLIDQARKASARAYAPYSKFPVGAAVEAPDGSIYTAANVENASYGLTCCAERGAVFALVSAGHREFKKIAIYTPTAEPTAPCGACRQVLAEFSMDAYLLSCCDSDLVLSTTISALLPYSFELKPNR